MVARNSTGWAAVAAFALPWLWIASFSWVWFGALAGGIAVTEVHVRAHRRVSRASFYRALQDIGIVQSAPQHWGHPAGAMDSRSEEHTSELQSLMRISYAVFCLTKKKNQQLT